MAISKRKHHPLRIQTALHRPSFCNAIRARTLLYKPTAGPRRTPLRHLPIGPDGGSLSRPVAHDDADREGGTTTHNAPRTTSRDSPRRCPRAEVDQWRARGHQLSPWTHHRKSESDRQNPQWLCFSTDALGLHPRQRLRSQHIDARSSLSNLQAAGTESLCGDRGASGIGGEARRTSKRTSRRTPPSTHPNTSLNAATKLWWSCPGRTNLQRQNLSNSVISSHCRSVKSTP